MGQGTKKNINKYKKTKKKQAWYQNSKEPDEGACVAKIQKITSSQQVTEGRMGLKKKLQCRCFLS